MYTSDRSNFGADGPFFRIIREGLEGLADGEDYFDLLARRGPALARSGSCGRRVVLVGGQRPGAA